MCDTIVVVGQDKVLFAKNSDREVNEAQVLDWQPRRSHPVGSGLRCTHIEIEQVPETHAVFLSRPFWMWGAEMGTNEHGVTIGNEAVFTDQPYAKTGLTGMDLLRLSLERASTAKKAVDVIAELLERYGQGGGCGFEQKGFTYHNSFLIADPTTAYVVETAGKKWAVEHVESGVRSISNGLTIPGFAATHGERFKTRVACAAERRSRTEALGTGANSVTDLFRALRDHGCDGDGPRYAWLNGGMHAPCMHAGGLAVNSQTTASWVAQLGKNDIQHWVTGTAAPCLSVFKPVYCDEPIDTQGAPTGRADDDSLWWSHERLHREVMRDWERLSPLVTTERDELEVLWSEEPPDSTEAFRVAGERLAAWIERVAQEPATDARPWHARWFWKRQNRKAGLGIRG